MLYVNNIRSYYNILKWLTANEEPAEFAEDGEPPEETAPGSETADEEREITET